MTVSVYKRLLDYFQGVSDALAGAKQASAVFPNAVDAGTSREELRVHFLRNHVPRRCEVIRSGFLFDDQGSESKQLDIMVTNDLTHQFKPIVGSPDEGKSFNVIEGRFAAIAVKTSLDKTALHDSIENLASIPATPSVQINPFLKADEILRELPLRILFAFEGAAPETVLGHLEAYYSMSDVPLNRRPNMIIVNNAYRIVKTKTSGATTRDGP